MKNRVGHGPDSCIWSEILREIEKLTNSSVAQKSFKNWHVGGKAVVKLLISSDINAPYALGG